MQTIGERVKLIRTDKKMSQEEFGNIILVSRSQIAAFETNRREITERNMRDLCQYFNVNEEWLRTGQGEMYSISREDAELAAALAEITLSDNETLKQLATKIAKLDETFINHIEAIVDGLLQENQKKSK